ncbi:MAG: hypothetical protein JWO82_3486 [Akkermansiaceae bacterium]|nr:hypothetical protein [Akkermansiaceae bacterium]
MLHFPGSREFLEVVRIFSNPGDFEKVRQSPFRDRQTGKNGASLATAMTIEMALGRVGPAIGRCF